MLRDFGSAALVAVIIGMVYALAVYLSPLRFPEGDLRWHVFQAYGFIYSAVGFAFAWDNRRMRKKRAAEEADRRRLRAAADEAAHRMALHVASLEAIDAFAKAPNASAPVIAFPTHRSQARSRAAAPVVPVGIQPVFGVVIGLDRRQPADGC